jgi:hypothetical protein
VRTVVVLFVRASSGTGWMVGREIYCEDVNLIELAHVWPWMYFPDTMLKLCSLLPKR